MPTVRAIEDLTAWRKAKELVSEIYDFSKSPDVEKDFGYRDQIRRAAMSAMSNIAEGFERRSDKEFAHFLSLSIASASEVQSMLHAGRDIGYLSEQEFERMRLLCKDTIRTTSKLQGYLRRSIQASK